MYAGLLVPVLVIVVIVLVVRRSGMHAGGGSADGHTVRRVFQYVLLYGLLVVVAVGLSGLLGRAFERDVLVTGDETGLARELAFLVVGGPLFAGLALWSRRRFAADPGESRSVGWAFYVTAASLTALVMAMTGLGAVLAWAFGLEDYSGFGVAQLVVWGGVWGAHWWVDRRTTPQEHTRVHHFAGALVGLVTAAVGLGMLLAGALRILLGIEGDAVVGSDTEQLRAGLVTVLVGAPVWLLYWVLTASRRRDDALWSVYVLLAGVAGGMITAVVSASTLLYSTLVWLVGDPGGDSAVTHFEAAPAQIAATAVGTALWWYHQAVLRASATSTRTEVRRVYEYVLAGIGLLAAAGGLIMVVAALFEALAGTAMIGGNAVNALLAAATLLAVGGPVWWIYWHGAQAAAHADPDEELRSPTRRVYLLLLFGVGGVAAVVALIVGVYLLLQDVVEGVVGAETVRSVRFAAGVLLATAAITGYHAAVYRSDREHTPTGPERHLPRYVLLVGPEGREVAREVAHRTHGRVQSLVRVDNGHTTWTADEVMAAIGDSAADEVMVLADPEGLRTIPFHR